MRIGGLCHKNREFLIGFFIFPRPRTRNRQTPEMFVTSITGRPSMRVTNQELGDAVEPASQARQRSTVKPLDAPCGAGDNFHSEKAPPV
jgi:hypothetical protein